MTSLDPTPDLPVRGPADHAVRDQIISAAHGYFAHYGYEKTTVADLARAIGFSKAYIYRFFESKQAIGEAICLHTTGKLFDQVQAAVDTGESATEKLRLFAETVTAAGLDLLFNEHKLHAIAAHASMEKWPSSVVYTKRLLGLIQAIVKQGRATGEFERKTPIDEAARAIFYALMPFVNPIFLEQNQDILPRAQTDVTSLILRSLAP